MRKHGRNDQFLQKEEVKQEEVGYLKMAIYVEEQEKERSESWKI